MSDKAVCQTSCSPVAKDSDFKFKEEPDEADSGLTNPFRTEEGDVESIVKPDNENDGLTNPHLDLDGESTEEPVQSEEEERSPSATWERTPTASEEEEKNDATMVFSVHVDPVFSIATFGTQILSGRQDDKAFLWDLKNQCEPFEISLEDSAISVGFSHDGQQFSAASMDGRLEIYENSNPPNLLHTLETGDIEWTEWHPKGEAIAAGCSDGTVWLWSTKSGKNLAVFVGQGGRCTCGKWTIDGKYLVTGHELCYVKLWNPKTGAAKLTFDPKTTVFHEATITSIDTDPNNSRLAVSCGADGTARLLSLKKGNVLQVIEHTRGKLRSGFECGCFSPFPSLTFVATADLNGHVQITDISKSRVRATIDIAEKGVSNLLWDVTEKGMLWAATLDGRIMKIDARSGEVLQTLCGHSMQILDLAFVRSPDFRGLVSCGDDTAVLIYEF
jgi:WD40 repeat protein